MKRLALLLAVMALSSSAVAAGIDSRSVRCGDLQALIATHGYNYSAPPFGDFVVANRSLCSGSDRLQPRSVATLDAPQCPVNYCIPTFREDR